MADMNTVIPLTDTDKALIDAWAALSVFVDKNQGTGWAAMVEDNDPQALLQGLEARQRIEDVLPVHVLFTVLPAYTKVRFTINGGTAEGQLREGAWGLCHRDRVAVYARRITTTMGFETWIGPDTVVDAFEVLDKRNT